MVAKKHASKRQSLKDKYKIVRKVREYKRKLKRKGLRDPNEIRKSRRDPGIPNSFPMKADVIAEMTRERERLEAEKTASKAAKKAAAEKKKKQGDVTPMVMEKANNNNTQVHPVVRIGGILKQVLQDSDMIFEVLDVRDPLGSRCYSIERQVTVGKIAKSKQGAKPIILVLNKCDLVPPTVVEAWIQFFKNDYPVVAFYANSEIETLTVSGMFVKKEDCCAGMSSLIDLMTHYERSNVEGSSNNCLSVAVIGYNNVGKSSVINTLTRTNAVGVSATPGYTKDAQKIRLKGVDASKGGQHNSIYLFDTPGIPVTDTDVGPHTVLPLEPAEPICEQIINSVDSEVVCRAFCIAEFDDFEDFLNQLATKNSLYKKGGVLRLHTAARTLLKQWNEGKIAYLTLPPEEETEQDMENEDKDTESKSAISLLLDAANTQTLNDLASRKLRVPEDTFLVLRDSLLSGNADSDNEDDEHDMDNSDNDNKDDDEDENDNDDMAMIEQPPAVNHNKKSKANKSSSTAPSAAASTSKKESVASSTNDVTSSNKKDTRRGSSAAATVTASTATATKAGKASKSNSSNTGTQNTATTTVTPATATTTSTTSRKRSAPAPTSANGTAVAATAATGTANKGKRSRTAASSSAQKNESNEQYDFATDFH